jgi:Calcineurin-like phosphoesterase
MSPGVPHWRGGHRRVAVHLLTAWLLGAAACVSAPPSGAPAPGSPAAAAAATAPAPSAAVPLGSAQGSFTFAVIGDNGTGDAGQYDTGRQLFAAYQRQAFPLVIMVGDNIYGSERPQDFVRKFEAPYRPLLDAGVKFYASLGNHDSREQRYYKPYNMEGKLYYSLTSPEQDVRFFALDSTYLDKPQVEWLEKELSGSKERWKIPFFHHPPYSSGGRHGSDLRLRAAVEPLFIQHGVTVVFTGHDHFYERTRPQQGITYFVTGSAGKLARGDLRNNSPLMARGFDNDQAFMVVNIDGDRLTFQAISRSGKIVDSGAIERRKGG